MKASDRKLVMTQVETLMNQYCNGCFLHRYMKKEKGRRAAHCFCIRQCTVGEQIQEIGRKLH